MNHSSDRFETSIAIIGTEGSGKTVLTTTLAKHLSTITSRGVFLNPQGVTTQKYVARVWNTLQNGDWPPSTTPGELFELRWKLQIDRENTKADVRFVDAAGQDFRLLFAEDRCADSDSLPESLRTLASYCRSADIILFLVNLRDFIGEGNPARRIDNEAAIKGAMDHLSGDGRPRRFCLVFTQVDIYEQYAAKQGGWLSVARDAIPIVFAAYLANGNVPLFPVSAVNTTRLDVDDSGRRLPKPGFGSDGFDELVDWMTTQVQEVRRKALPSWLVWLRDWAPGLAEGIERDCLEWIEKHMAAIKRALWGGLAVFLLLSLLIVQSCDGPPGGEGSTSRSSPTHPQPVITREWNKPEPGFFDDHVVSYVEVTNEGAAGNVRVTSTVIENGEVADRRSDGKFLNAGETQVFTIRLPGIYSVKNPYRVENQESVPGVPTP